MLLKEQILPFKSKPYLRKEAIRNLQTLSPPPPRPLVNMVKGGRFIPDLNDLALRCTNSFIYLQNARFNKILGLATPLSYFAFYKTIEVYVFVYDLTEFPNQYRE